MDFKPMRMLVRVDPGTELVDFKTLDIYRAVIVVGPAGIGKSTLLNADFQDRIDQLQQLGAKINLSAVHTKQELFDAASPRLHELSILSKGGLWNLLIEGVDYSSVAIAETLEWLMQWVKAFREAGLSEQNLRIRASTRDVSFSNQLHAVFEKIFGPSQAKVVNLDFTREAALEILSASTSDSRAFVSAAEAGGASALLARPMTLRLLIEQHERYGDFAKDPRELFRRSVQLRLENENPSMVQGAGELAAVMLISGKLGVSVGDFQSPENVWAMRAEGDDLARDHIEQLRVVVVPALLRAGLLVSDNASELRWVHSSIAEYLAAFFLESSGLTFTDVMRLLKANIAGREQIRPSLREVAAWLAILSESMLRDIVADDPALLLDSDVILQSKNAKKALLMELFALHSTPLWDWGGSNSERYAKLNFEGIEEVIREVLKKDAERSSSTKIFALDVIEAIELWNLADEMVALAKDTTEDSRVRSRATYLVARHGSSSQRLQMVELTMTTAEEDPDDEIKGWALEATWPEHLAQEWLYKVLTAPRNEKLIGAYSHFLYSADIPKLNAEGASQAVKWLVELPSGRLNYSFKQIAEKTLLRFWQAAEEFRLVDEFVTLLVTLIGNFSHPLRDLERRNKHEDLNFSSVEFKSSTLQELTLRLTEKSNSPNASPASKILYWSPYSFLSLADATWMIDVAAGLSDSQFRRTLVDCLTHFAARASTLKEVEFIWDAADRVVGLAKSLEEATTIPLDSESVTYFREERERERKRMQQEDSREKFSDSFDKQVKLFESGDVRGWWILNMLLLTGDHDRVDEFHSRLDDTTNWLRLTEAQHATVVGLAKKYLEAPQLTRGWLAPNVHHRPAAAVFRALRLLWDRDRGFVEAASSEDWAVWQLPILAFQNNGSALEEDVQRSIFRYGLSRYPENGLPTVKEYVERLGASASTKVVDFIGEAIGSDLMDYLWKTWSTDSSISTNSYVNEQLANVFAKLRYPPFESYFRNELRDPPSVERAQRFISSAVAKSATDPLLIGRTIVDLLLRVPKVGTEIMSGITGGRSHVRPFLEAQPLETLRKLYSLTKEHFPEPPEEDGAYIVTSAHDVAQFRRKILDVLVENSGEEAVAVLIELKELHSDQPWLNYYVERAISNAREKEIPIWAPEAVIVFMVRTAANAVVTAASVDDGSVAILDELSEERPTEEGETTEQDLTEGSEANYAFLFFATEWASGHGGLSTINREMCVHLARLGHRVICYAPEASAFDIQQASELNVQLQNGEGLFGFDLREKLGHGPEVPGIKIDYVVGHDHITGHVAFAWAKARGISYVHVVHTQTDRLSSVKLLQSNDIAVLRTADERNSLTVHIGKSAAITVGIGPKLHRFVRSQIQSDRTHELTPGLTAELLSHSPDIQYLSDPRCLFFGRADDQEVKGLHLIAGAVSRLRSSFGASSKSIPEFVIRGVKDDVADLKKLFNGNMNNIVPKAYSTSPGDVSQDIKRASLLLMPSMEEGFGLVALEALSAGLPFLVSDNSGFAMLLRGLVEKGEAHEDEVKALIVIHTGDVAQDTESWAMRIESMLSDREGAFRRASALRERLKSRLTWANAMNDLVQKLRTLEDPLA